MDDAQLNFGCASAAQHSRVRPNMPSKREFNNHPPCLDGHAVPQASRQLPVVLGQDLVLTHMATLAGRPMALIEPVTAPLAR